MSKIPNQVTILLCIQFPRGNASINSPTPHWKKQANNRTMLSTLKNNAAAGYQVPVEIELLKVAGLMHCPSTGSKY